MAGKKPNLDYYLSLEYPIELIRESEQGGYFARHPDLLGCTAEGETAEEAVRNLDESRELWLEARLESGYPVPEPSKTGEFAGRISLRIPPSLHAFLAHAATRQDLSLNQLLSTILSEWAGGLGVRDRIVEELRGLIAAATSEREVTETTRTEIRTETKSQTRSLRLVHSEKAFVATTEAGH